MTTKAAAEQYEAEHLQTMKGRDYVVYNPNSIPIEELPVIYGFNNGGRNYFLKAIAIAEDGVILGQHMCSSEGYMRADLGFLEGTRQDRHEDYQKHYPNGYRMEFIASEDIALSNGLQKAIELRKSIHEENKQQ